MSTSIYMTDPYLHTYLPTYLPTYIYGSSSFTVCFLIYLSRHDLCLCFSQPFSSCSFAPLWWLFHTECNISSLLLPLQTIEFKWFSLSLSLSLTHLCCCSFSPSFDLPNKFQKTDGPTFGSINAKNKSRATKIMRLKQSTVILPK